MENDNTNMNTMELYRALNDSEVLDVAVIIMDRFDEAFKELAK